MFDDPRATASSATAQLGLLTLCINHSCMPNSETSGNSTFAIQPIASGDEITISYHALELILRPARVRRQRMYAGRGFDCQCRACRGSAHDALDAKISEGESQLGTERQAVCDAIVTYFETAAPDDLNDHMLLMMNWIFTEFKLPKHNWRRLLLFVVLSDFAKDPRLRVTGQHEMARVYEGLMLQKRMAAEDQRVSLLLQRLIRDGADEAQQEEMAGQVLQAFPGLLPATDFWSRFEVQIATQARAVRQEHVSCGS